MTNERNKQNKTKIHKPRTKDITNERNNEIHQDIQEKEREI